MALVACGVAAVRCASDRARQNAQARAIAEEVADGHEYDWSHLVASGQARSYDDGAYEAVWGIDVSSFQGDVDWAKVKAAGVRFVMIRVGYRGYATGALVEDDRFEQNVEGAVAAGLDVGFYVFSQAVSEDEAREEADFVADRIGGYVTSYPVAFDMEDVTGSDRIAGLTVAERTSIARAFCAEVEARGYYPMVYGNGTWFRSSVDASSLSDYPLWLADYNVTPARTSGFQMLQYAEEASVDGIGDSGVDLDLCFLRKAS